MSTSPTPPPADDFPELPGLNDADDLVPMTPSPLAPKPIQTGKKKPGNRKGRRGKREESKAGGDLPAPRTDTLLPEEPTTPVEEPSPEAPEIQGNIRDTRPERLEHFPAPATKLVPLDALEIDDAPEIPAAEAAAPPAGNAEPDPSSEPVEESAQMEEPVPVTSVASEESMPPEPEAATGETPEAGEPAEDRDPAPDQEMAMDASGASPAAATPPPEDSPTPAVATAVSGREILQKMAGGISPSERRWLGILGGGLLVVLTVFYFLLRGGLPTANPHQATLAPSLPIEGTKVSIEHVELGWLDRGANSLSGGINAMTLFPEATLGFSPKSNGAVRLFFRDERGRQVGDTVSFEVRDGKVGADSMHRITCTEGLRSRLDYDDLRARGDVHWAIEIHEGSDPFGSLSGFTLLAKISIPWNLGTKP